jgi:outer membrane usher protein
MPATSTRTSTCRTETRRRALLRAVAIAFAGTALQTHAGLRLSHRLEPPATNGIPVPPAPVAVALRIDRALGAQRTGASYEEMFLEVDLNRQGINKPMLVLRRGDRMFLLKAEDLAAFRLKTPSTAPYIHDGMPFFPVDALGDARFEFDEARQRLAIMAGAEAFESTVDTVPGARRSAKAVRPTLGGFLNYDLVAIAGAGPAFMSGTLEAGVFTPYGVFINSMLATHDTETSRATRVESTFISDFPGRRTTLRVGDTVSRPGSWGSAIRIGGVQYGTNFSTDPGFITFPTQPIRGQAVVPSLVDLYVNNALVATRRVEPGPFTISNIPFATGSGTLRMVVRDLNNQQQILTLASPFYSSNTLLKQGLSDYSAELGKVREDFAIESFGYGDAVAAGTFRHGFTNWLTAEVHGEGQRDQRALGFSATALHPTIGQFDATVAASQGDAGNGHLAGVGYQRQATPVSFGGQVQWATPDFRRAGDLGDLPTLRRQQTFAVGLQTPGFGSATLGYAEQRFSDETRIAITSLNYSLGLGSWGQLNVTALRTRGQQENVAIAAGITVPLGANMNAAAQLESSGRGPERRRELLTSFQRNRSGDSPYSYRVATRGSEIEGAFDYRGDRFESELGLARTESNVVTGRVQLSGGLGVLSDYAFLSRRISGSFGVVKVADYPNVGVLFENQLVGRTDARGYFVLPDLRPYDRNSLSIREADLPLDATVGSLKLDASPYYRSVVLGPFPVKRARSGVLTVLLPGGTPLPPGAIVRVDDNTEEFPSALHGEVYVTGLAMRSRLTVRWKGQSCDLDVIYPDTTDPLPDLGTFNCQGVQP